MRFLLIFRRLAAILNIPKKSSHPKEYFNLKDIEKKNTTNGAIDALRGVSILTVLLLHLNIRVPFSGTYIGGLLPKLIYNVIFWSGYYGVCIFFVISGFLICNSVYKRWHALQEINLKGFYVMRIARIMPLLLSLIIVLSLLHLINIDEFTINPQQTSLFRTILAALTFHINYLEIQIGYLPASWDILWSLSIEEFFYFFFPIVCVFLKKESRVITFLVIFLILSPFARTGFYINNELGDRNYFAYLDAISLGCISAMVVNRIKLSSKSLKVIIILGWIFFLLVFIFRKWSSLLGLSKSGLNITFLALGVSLILIWMQNQFINGNLSIKKTSFIRIMGRYSYEIYLTHMFVVIFFVNAFNYLKLSGEFIWLLYFVSIMFSTILGKLIGTYFTNPLNNYIREQYK
jgi:peptidoglycan/LPS O-acetylase OafA/YrhL